MTELTKAVRRTAEVERMPHGFRRRLVITLHPGAILEVREARRHESVRLDIGTLYAKAILAKAQEKLAKKRGGRT